MPKVDKRELLTHLSRVYLKGLISEVEFGEDFETLVTNSEHSLVVRASGKFKIGRSLPILDFGILVEAVQKMPNEIDMRITDRFELCGEKGKICLLLGSSELIRTKVKEDWRSKVLDNIAVNEIKLDYQSIGFFLNASGLKFSDTLLLHESDKAMKLVYGKESENQVIVDFGKLEGESIKEQVFDASLFITVLQQGIVSEPKVFYGDGVIVFCEGGYEYYVASIQK